MEDKNIEEIAGYDPVLVRRLFLLHAKLWSNFVCEGEIDISANCCSIELSLGKET